MAPLIKASLYLPLARESRLNVRIKLSGMIETSSSIKMIWVNRSGVSVAAIIPRANPPEPPVLGFGSTVTSPSESDAESSVCPLSTTNMWKWSRIGPSSLEMPALTSSIFGRMYCSFLNVVVERARLIWLIESSGTSVR